jgi:carbon-monoxide dehydrogenase medium subunit
MTSFDYHRPKTIEDALSLLKTARALAGGTAVTPARRETQAVVDLQSLRLDKLTIEKGLIHVGATCKLQALVEASGHLPEALATAAQLEAPLNLRHMATLGGTLIACDGRSPLVTVLLAAGATAHLAPDDAAVDLASLLDARPQGLAGKLITRVELPIPAELRYEQVARTPKDRPLVCVSLGSLETKGGNPALLLALGGHGARPRRVPLAEAALARGDVEGAAAAAAREYSAATDAWASAEYRAHVAAVLTRRLGREVVR